MLRAVVTQAPATFHHTRSSEPNSVTQTPAPTKHGLTTAHSADAIPASPTPQLHHRGSHAHLDLKCGAPNALCQDCSPGYANPLHTATQYQGGRHSPRGLMGHTQGLLGARVASTKRAGVTSLRGWSISCAQGLREPGNPVAFQRRQGSDLFVLSMGRY